MASSPEALTSVLLLSACAPSGAIQLPGSADSAIADSAVDSGPSETGDAGFSPRIIEDEETLPRSLLGEERIIREEWSDGGGLDCYKTSTRLGGYSFCVQPDAVEYDDRGALSIPVEVRQRTLFPPEEIEVIIADDLSPRLREATLNTVSGIEQIAHHVGLEDQLRVQLENTRFSSLSCSEMYDLVNADTNPQSPKIYFCMADSWLWSRIGGSSGMLAGTLTTKSIYDGDVRALNSIIMLNPRFDEDEWAQGLLDNIDSRYGTPTVEGLIRHTLDHEGGHGFEAEHSWNEIPAVAGIMVDNAAQSLALEGGVFAEMTTREEGTLMLYMYEGRSNLQSTGSTWPEGAGERLPSQVKFCGLVVEPR